MKDLPSDTNALAKIVYAVQLIEKRRYREAEEELKAMLPNRSAAKLLEEMYEKMKKESDQ